jgi:hypothetical protein
MRPTAQSTNQIRDIFGGSYLPEQHGDTLTWTPSAGDENVIGSLSASMFDELLKSLRAALSLH